MAEAIILPVAKSILEKLASFAGDLATDYVVEEIKAAKSAKKDLKIIAAKMEAICAVLEDAEEKQFTNKAMKLWLRDLKSVVYDIDDLLDEVAFDSLKRKVNEGEFRRQLRYYLSSSNPVIFSFQLSRKIKDLREKLENIVSKKNEFGLTERPVETSRDEIRDPLDESDYVYKLAVMGRDEAKQDIIRKLLAFNDTRHLSMLPIVGMGGIGKTTLAKLVYKDVHHFDLKLWTCISDKFQIRKIIEDILENGSGENIYNQSFNTLVKKLHSLLNGKKYFLVLDDVWVEDFAMWAELRNVLSVGKAGSVILITTRNPKVASITETTESYNLDCLPDHVCWSIFKQLAFNKGEEDTYPDLCDIGRSIIKKCRGIPLVVKSLGSLLRNERNMQEWKRINCMDSFIELNQHYDKVMQLLKLSYDKLPSHLKPCFAHMSLYVKDRDLSTNYVSHVWSALGLLPLRNRNKDIEDSGYSYFMELVSKSLIQEPTSHCLGNYCNSRMHDLLHDLAVKILGEELIVVVNKDKLVVSEFTRHIVWGYNNSISLQDQEFPKELLKAINLRTFLLGYRMNQPMSQAFLEGIISSFSCLRLLDLQSSCFEELPRSIGNLKHLRYLDLSCNPIIKSLPNTICNLLYLETFCIHGCEQLQELPRNIHKLQSLKKFIATTCQVSLVGTKFIELSSLQILCLISCKQLISLWDDDNVGRLTSLLSLVIINCPKLTSLPNSMKFLAGLKFLQIDNCEELDLDKGEGLQGLHSLRALFICHMKLSNLPQGIQSATTSLQNLIIIGCRNLVELPDWLHCFTSLRSFKVEDCPNLLGLPQSICRITSLQKLFFKGCPALSKRCAVPNGEDFYLINHVPKLMLDGVRFFPQQVTEKDS
ncbi:hypothetical protein SOVF_117760 [Spinacia oleracea]|nr:hypothetical protein SOVF_117760 [Spinacia oleracea]